MAQNCNMKSRALGKDEILLLLDLISKHPVITTKATNATNNRLKEDAWKSIAQEFTAMVGEMRRPEQLRLKWENLKKAARKRSAMIRHNNVKTGGGKQFIPPDEALDRVVNMLGVTCGGHSVGFGRDREETLPTASIVPVNKRRKLNEEYTRAQISKELAMATYFQAKAERVRLENIKLELEINQLQNSKSGNVNLSVSDKD